MRKNQLSKKLKESEVKIMAGVAMKYGDRANIGFFEFVCDTIDECVNEAPTTTRKGTGAFEAYQQYAPIGSTCIVGNNGDTKVFMLFSNGWQEV